MKTLDEALSYAKELETIDNRLLNRLLDFTSKERIIETFGIDNVNLEALESHQQLDYTKDNLLSQLKSDVAFGFDKALSKRGISANLMYEVVLGWCYILDNKDLYEKYKNVAHYPQYGLPLFKAVALYYGFPNEIGDDNGNESQYESD